MKTMLQFILVAVLGVGAIVFVGLFAMSGVATSHEIIRVPVPRDSYLSGNVRTADYADAYSAPMRFSSYRTIEEVAENAFHKGQEAHRDDHEVAYRGKAPGLDYHISYILDLGARPRTLTVATTVNFRGWVGRAYWFVTRPIHRMLVPVMLDRMAQAAPQY